MISAKSTFTVLALLLFVSLGCAENNPQKIKGGAMKLPEPRYSSKMSVEEALKSRRSIRSYKDTALSLNELAQLLWAAQGITAKWGGRTAPSAGATYPLEIYAVVGKVENLEAGLYHYNPQDHTITKQKTGDLRSALANAALGQTCVREAPIDLIFAARYERTTRRYRERGIRYVHMEIGHVGQNIYLQAEALGLGTVAIGAFYDDKVKKVLGIEEEPLYIMPVGKK
ncbi:MAG TPA: SagB/ThcOx family dehydrogenase [bacterium (Candidatus Stahlbacteria)]|nr:SagB/ThcOx family dehydrogenase [Candidatus Stahlbacteria bacterium]